MRQVYCADMSQSFNTEAPTGATLPPSSTALLQPIMPFVITCLLAPLCLCMAVYRLLSIPLRLHSGTLRFNTTLSVAAPALAALAYLALLGYTTWLGLRVYSGLPYQVADIAEIVRLVLYFEAYPLLYVLSEWRFSTAFKAPWVQLSPPTPARHASRHPETRPKDLPTRRD